MLCENGFNFTQLNSEPAKFYLIVESPEIFNIPVGQPATQVASAVHARAALLAERIRKEAF